jgi:hypothetical protein
MPHVPSYHPDVGFARPSLSVFAIGAVLSTACAGQLHLLERGPAGGVSPSSFWPPPESTSVKVVEVGEPTFGDAAARVARALRDGGYVDARWFPIGAGFRHGFAVTTRLESIDDEGAPFADGGRWHSIYPEPPTLRWLAGARQIRVAALGRHRTLLIAVTDLPMTTSDAAPRWNEETIMEGPGVPDGLRETDVPGRRPLPKTFQLGTYVYEYEAKSLEAPGAFVRASGSRPR